MLLAKNAESFQLSLGRQIMCHNIVDNIYSWSK